MKTNTHTPGPWSLSKVGNHYDEYTVYPEGNGTSDVAYIRTGQADAHLVAASPDMLVALQHVQQWAEGYSEAVGFKLVWLDQVDAAIAKAEGKS